MKVLNDKLIYENQPDIRSDKSTIRRKVIENKWVLKVKCKSNESIKMYKTHLVVKKYTKHEDINYEKTFSPILRLVPIHLILAIVAYMDLEFY